MFREVRTCCVFINFFHKILDSGVHTIIFLTNSVHARKSIISVGWVNHCTGEIIVLFSAFQPENIIVQYTNLQLSIYMLQTFNHIM